MRSRYDSSKGRMKTLCAPVIGSIDRVRRQRRPHCGHDVTGTALPGRAGHCASPGRKTWFLAGQEVANGEVADG